MFPYFFDQFSDFPKVILEFKGILLVFAIFVSVFSYLHHYEMHASTHDKLLRALSSSKLET